MRFCAYGWPPCAALFIFKVSLKIKPSGLNDYLPLLCRLYIDTFAWTFPGDASNCRVEVVPENFALRDLQERNIRSSASYLFIFPGRVRVPRISFIAFPAVPTEALAKVGLADPPPPDGFGVAKWVRKNKIQFLVR